MMMATTTGIGQHVDPSRPQAGKWSHDLEVVAQHTSDFGVLGDSRHMTADTV